MRLSIRPCSVRLSVSAMLTLFSLRTPPGFYIFQRLPASYNLPTRVRSRSRLYDPRQTRAAYSKIKPRSALTSSHRHTFVVISVRILPSLSITMYIRWSYIPLEGY